MRRVNLDDVPTQSDPEDPDGYRARSASLGARTGAERTGTSLYELDPGQAVCPYHYEHGEEEWLLVLTGRPTLRHPEGVEKLAPNDVVFFPIGPEGAHQVHNAGTELVRVLMWSTVVHPTATVYPDSDKVAIWTGGDRSDDLMAHRSSGVPYYDGEPDRG